MSSLRASESWLPEARRSHRTGRQKADREASPSGQATAVDKACAVIWAVARRDMTGVGVTDLTRRLGLPKSTTFRLLKALVRNRVLDRYGEHYRLGEVFTDAIPTGPQVDLVQKVITPFLAQLYERTRCTVQLAVLDDAEVVFLNKLHGVHRVPSPSRIGGRAPAHCTSVGKVLLAFDRESTELAIRRGLDQWTSRSLIDPHALSIELATVRKNRIGIDDGEYLTMVGSIGAPVLVDGKAVAAMCVTGPRNDVIGAGHEQVLLHVCAQAARAYQRAKEAADKPPA